MPRRTVRLRLTLLYGALFLASGALLLGITYVLVSHNTGNRFIVKGQVRPLDADGSVGKIQEPPELKALTSRLRAQAERQREEQMRSLLVQSGIALGLMTIASLGIGWLIAGRILRPMEEAHEAQRRFVANASHELRTPLTMMRTSLDVAAAKPGAAVPEVALLDLKLREGLDRADRLVDSFLTLARAEGEGLPDQRTLSLPALVERAIDDRASAVAERSIEVHRDLREADVTGTETLLARLVENVVDNAVRHNEDAGWISVATRNGGSTATLVVESGGRRLEEAEVRELAQPFRRLGAERTEGGVGLGLSIVTAIAAAHGGRLDLAARPDGGLRVAVELPA